MKSAFTHWANLEAARDEGHDSLRFVSSFLSFMKYFLTLSRSMRHQQHEVGLSMVNASLSF